MGPFQRCSLIDAVFMRRAHCDAVARTTCSHPACPLGRERGDPSWHSPIRGSFSTFWRPWECSRSPKPGAVFNLDQLSADYRQHSQRIQKAQAELGQRLCQTSHTPTSLNDCVSEVVNKYYPNSLPKDRTDQAISNPLYATKWRLWKALRRPCGISLQAFILRWHMIARFYSLSRACKIEARRRKARRIDGIFQEARIAAESHDIRMLYRAIRKLAPKKPKERIKLKAADGGHLTMKAELEHLLDHFTHVFADIPDDVCTASMHQTYLSIADVQDALASLPAWKAAPISSLPNIIWKAFASAIAPALHRLLQNSVHSQSIPRAWQDSWLILLPKPGKLGHHAKDLRPISLQDPGGKAILKQVTLRARSYCISNLCALPLYGYLPLRGTADALQRVFMHCFSVEEACRMNTYSIHRLKQGHQTTELTGGIQLAIDISSAFDRVERQRLWQALDHSEVPQDLAAILQHWHSQAFYHLEHAGLKRCFQSTRGVRQGCVAAPLLWVLYSRGWIHDLAAKVGWEWLLKGLTIYADDVHAAWKISSEDDFLKAIVCIRVILQSLSDIGLSVNKNKTVVILRMVGKLSRKLRKAYVVKEKDGFYLKLWQLQSDSIMTRVKIVRSHLYLGAVITYFSPAEQTFTHRKKAAISSYNTLRCWWAKGSLAVEHKLQLWKTCVWPCLTYALSTVGLTEKTKSILRGLVMRQVRKITGERWTQDGLKPEELFRKHKLMDPVVEVSLQHLRRWKRRTETMTLLDSQDILRHPVHAHDSCTWFNQWNSQALQHVQQAGHDSMKYRDIPRDMTARLPALPAPASLQCQVCQKQFPSMRSLKVHQGRMHKELVQLKGTFDRALDAVAGMPICRWCGVKFLHWPGLQLHHVSLACSGKQRIEQGATPVVNVAEAVRFRPLAQILLGPEPMQDLSLDEHVLKDLSEHCIICHQWTNRATSLSKHVNTHLRRCDLAQVRRVYVRQIPLEKFTSPCQWCKRSFVDSKHTCLVFWQRALLQVWTSASSATVEQDGTESGTARTYVSTARDRHDIGTSDGETCHASRSAEQSPHQRSREVQNHPEEEVQTEDKTSYS